MRSRSPTPIALAELGDRWEGTKVAGHPVIPSLLIDDAGVVQGIRVVTDSDTRMYLKKKAFLLGIRVMGRYGRDGWTCTEAEPGAGRTPVGGLFIDRRCEKTFHDRRLILETDSIAPPSSRARSSPARPGSRSSRSQADADVTSGAWRRR